MQTTAYEVDSSKAPELSDLLFNKFGVAPILSRAVRETCCPSWICQIYKGEEETEASLIGSIRILTDSDDSVGVAYTVQSWMRDYCHAKNMYVVVYDHIAPNGEIVTYTDVKRR